MNGNWEKDNERGRRLDRLNACPTGAGRTGQINPATMLGLLAMMPAWQWFSIVTSSLYLVPAADAMIRQSRDFSSRVPLD
jgi:hypothetical protein